MSYIKYYYYVQRLEPEEVWSNNVIDSLFSSFQDALDFIDDTKHSYRIMKQTSIIKVEEVYRTREI